MTDAIPSTDEFVARLRAQKMVLEAEGVSHALLFGSCARGEAGPGSDVDIAITLDPDRGVGLIAIAGLSRRLGALLGRKVDLVVLPVRREELRVVFDREGIHVI